MSHYLENDESSGNYLREMLNDYDMTDYDIALNMKAYFEYIDPNPIDNGTLQDFYTKQTLYNALLRYSLDVINWLEIIEKIRKERRKDLEA